MKNTYSIITSLLIATTVVSFAAAALQVVELCQAKAPTTTIKSQKAVNTTSQASEEIITAPIPLDANYETSAEYYSRAAQLVPEYKGTRQFTAKGIPQEYSNTIMPLQYETRQASASTVFAGTAVELETMIPLNAKFITAGQTIDLRVKYDIVVNRKIVIPAGSVAKAIVNDARRKKLFQKSKICIEPKYVQTPDGQYIPLSGRPAYFQSKDNFPLSTGTTLFASIAATRKVEGSMDN